MIRLAALFALTASCVGWSKTNTALESAFVIEQAVDYRQSVVGVDEGAEENPIMGVRGQNMSPQGYFLITTLLHVAVAAALPRGWREAWQGATIVSQGYNTYENVEALDYNRCVLTHGANCGAL